MSQRTRPDDEKYYVQDRTEHFAQGDIFENVPFTIAVPEQLPLEDNSSSIGSRRVLEVPLFVEGFGILLSHTSSFVAQPVGTRGYAHILRVLAPVFPITLLQEHGVLDESALGLLRNRDQLKAYMYLPTCPGAFRESVAALYRPALVHHKLLESRRLTQLQELAVKQLQAKIVEAFTGQWVSLNQWQPDVTDHWNPPPRKR